MRRAAEPGLVEYLDRLERALHDARPSTSADALADAREHLSREAWRQRVEHPELDAAEAFGRAAAAYGTPEEVARAYREADPMPGGWRGWYWRLRRLSRAPGWRIACRGCGRSVPLDRAAPLTVRLGARSAGRRVLGWCRECRRPRWLAVERVPPPRADG